MRLCVEAGAWQGAFNPYTYYHPEWRRGRLHCQGCKRPNSEGHGSPRERGSIVKDRGIRGSRPDEFKTLRLLKTVTQPHFALGGRSKPSEGKD
eukprot:3363621-Amphidinium_carterae.2